MKPPVIEFDGVEAAYRIGRETRTALRGITFSVASGESLALVGTSGAGKSTVGRLLLGLIRPVAGQITFFHQPLDQWLDSDRGSLRRRCQAIFQEARASLSPRMSVRDLLREPLHLDGVRSSREIERRSAEVLGRVGLNSDLLARKPHQLSGGEAQRICLARALLRHPQVLVCDEPTSGLDMVTESDIIALLDHLRERQGLTLLFMTHSLAIVRVIADRIAVLSEGEIVETGEVSTVLADPQHPVTRGLCDNTRLLAPKLHNS